MILLAYHYATVVRGMGYSVADVFLSYAREDLPFVRRLTAALRARSREVWVDLEDIIPSARWLEEIRIAITEADAVAFVITPDSVASEVCRIELDYATEASKRLVPILARETPPDGVPAPLAELNWLPFLDGIDFEAGIDRLVEVLGTDLDRVHLHTRLLTQAREWETRDRDRSLLLRGAELKEAETWLADQTGRKPAATPAQAQLILASRRAATRRQRVIGSTGVVLAVVMAVLTTYAFIQRQTAVHQRQTAIARELVANSAALVAKDPGASMLLAVEAFHYQPTPETRSALLSTQAQYFAGQLTGHNGFVTAVAFSPDGHLLATADADNSVRLWNVASHQLIAPLVNPFISNIGGGVLKVAFSPDGRTLASASADHKVRLWDVGGSILLSHPIDAFNGVAFSPTQQILATAGASNAAVLWSAATHQPIAILTGPDTVERVAFSPDGRTLATASGDDTVRLWNLDVGQVTKRVCRIVGTPSQDEWAQLIPDLPYQPICH
jgi:TIR domain/WD domain, G-beta repeat